MRRAHRPSRPSVLQPQPLRRFPNIWIFITLLLIMAAIILIVIFLPEYLTARWQDEYPSLTKDPLLTITTLRKSAFDWLTLFFSAASAVGLVGTLIFTARNFLIAEQTLRLAQESRLIEAYSKAAEQLTLATDPMAKFGALYALSRVAASSADYYRHVIPTLCTFVRRAAPVAGTEPPPAEVQVALDILGRRTKEWDDPRERLNLSNTNLSNLELNDGDFARVNFSRSDLSGADLSGATAAGALFAYAVVGNARFVEADLRDSDFSGATFAGAQFRGAHLGGANFQGASGFVVAPPLTFNGAQNVSLEIHEG